MTRFYATIQGDSDRATRHGTVGSGIQGHIRGNHVGAEVKIYADGDDDVVIIHLTGGSNFPGQRVHVGTYILDDLIDLSPHSA